MKCPRCGFENREVARFCLECGGELQIECPLCGKALPSRAKFCDECGADLTKSPEIPLPTLSKTAGPLAETEAKEAARAVPAGEGERKFVTALFSDISGYTVMSERLDPEELKEVTSLIFGRISAIIRRYDGFIEKYIGDAVVAIFGAHRAHEDDPVRAIRAAREIHELVEAISPRYEKKIGQPLSMHTGINTGIAVTGEIDFQTGKHGIVGDTINLAARLSSLGRAGEILVGADTYSQSEGFFRFEEREPAQIKGMAKPVSFYRVLSPLDEPRKTHGLHGRQAELVGRKLELAQLKEAALELQEKKGSIFFICGPAGTGKSRLVEEFKVALNLKEVQWREGHAYPYAQNIPYFPFVNLLSRVFQIEETDSPGRIREKLERGAKSLVGEKESVIPLLGSLYNLEYRELRGIDPEFWKNQLRRAIQSILSAMALQQPTIICLEDLHWADPSSLELLRLIMLEAQFPILFLCVYRPAISLLTAQQLSRTGKTLHEIQLQDLSPSETQDMLESLLRTRAVPSVLRNIIEEKVEGNPLYLEEVINSLIDSGTLVKENGRWALARPIADSAISRTIHGVISARLDSLERRAKRILQEAAVIGRSFSYEILKRITDHEQDLQSCLDDLVRLDLLRVKPLLQDREYDFKHALIQEVVYNGLLRRELQEIHERIGLAIEDLFRSRLAEFSETLAFHYRRGKSPEKAVYYLMQSGKKSLKRYAVEESHRYYKEAYDMLIPELSGGGRERRLLLELLNTWSPVFYFRGSFKELETLLKRHLDLAQSSEDKEERGMFYVWLGMSLWGRARFMESYRYLHGALKLGEQSGSKRVMGYVGAWLPWPCVELGFFGEALVHAERAREMSDHFEADYYPYYQSLDSTAFVHYAIGEPLKICELGEALLKYGQEKSSIRAITWGHYVKGWSYMAAGDFSSSIRSCERAIQSSPDPFYTQFPKLSLGMGYVSNQEYDKAKEPLQAVLKHAQDFGCEVLGTASQVFLGVIAIQAGRFAQGMDMLEEGRRLLSENQGRYRLAVIEFVLGEIFLNIAGRKKVPVGLPVLIKNFRFIIKEVPFASRKAEQHYYKAIEIARAIGVKGIQGQAYLGLGRLYSFKRKKHLAEECLSSAIRIFEECQARAFLDQSRETLAALRGTRSGRRATPD
jgi:class 3 adenylate cyclase/tetratricopeptide (TPR) repeat protein